MHKRGDTAHVYGGPASEWCGDPVCRSSAHVCVGPVHVCVGIQRAWACRDPVGADTGVCGDLAGTDTGMQGSGKYDGVSVPHASKH